MGTEISRGKADTGFLNRSVTVDRVRYRYQVYVPERWTPRRRWPIILFLHGAGERGEDGLLQTDVGLGTAIRRAAGRYRCVVVLPQCRKNVWWADPRMEAQALAALEWARREFNGDPRRVYLTGISMGGYGVWTFAARHPGRFAALAPICGGIHPPPGVRLPRGLWSGISATDPYAATARRITGTPVWVFHGAADPTVPVSESRKMVRALKAAGRRARYTEYRGVGHNSWDRAYAEPGFLTWLLSQRLAWPGRRSRR